MESTWQDKKELGESFLSSLQKRDWELLRNIVTPGVVIRGSAPRADKNTFTSGR
jgi:hypothetical protein